MSGPGWHDRSRNPHDLERLVRAQEHTYNDALAAQIMRNSVRAVSGDPIFQRLLDKYFDGQSDPETIRLMDATSA